jgi:hypothetical protein
MVIDGDLSVCNVHIPFAIHGRAPVDGRNTRTGYGFQLASTFSDFPDWFEII